MKTLLFGLILAVLFIGGCATDDAIFENQDNLELKKANVPVPFKADLYAVADKTSEPILIIGLDPEDPSSYTSSRMVVSGTGSHFGKIDPENSYYVFDRLELTFQKGQPFFIITSTGKITGANGDYMELAFRVVQSAIDGGCTGEAEIIPGSGTGKFEGSTGSLNFVGGYHEDGIGLWFKIDSYLTFK